MSTEGAHGELNQIAADWSWVSTLWVCVKMCVCVFECKLKDRKYLKGHDKRLVWVQNIWMFIWVCGHLFVSSLNILF